MRGLRDTGKQRLNSDIRQGSLNTPLGRGMRQVIAQVAEAQLIKFKIGADEESTTVHTGVWKVLVVTQKVCRILIFCLFNTHNLSKNKKI